MDTVTVLIPTSESTALSQVLEVIKILAPALLVILSAYLAYAFARHQASDERKRAFLLRQVTDFYSPMVGIRSHIRSLSQLRAEIEGLANDAWTQTVEEAPQEYPALSEHLEREFRPFDRLIEYNNKQLRQELLPQYERMLQIFANQYWLAESSTRSRFDELVKFVELWRRHLDEALPGRVLEQLKHSEAALQPLYDDIETVLDSLRTRLQSDRAI